MSFTFLGIYTLYSEYFIPLCQVDVTDEAYLIWGHLSAKRSHKVTKGSFFKKINFLNSL